ncbi:hypothetical protein MFLAVUS_004126 [Mucor flavus]|uniref:Uncharacterized protein n=1 Tax=Mucor flavus TaxID=439312 RepID=A0ABP9YV13_9FUNG
MLSTDFSKLPVVDLASIAKDSDVQNILLLCKIILYIAVFCPDNEKYIHAIQTQLLPQQQEYMVLSIDLFIGRICTESQTEKDNNPSGSYVDNGTYRSQSELSRVSKEKEELETQN